MDTVIHSVACYTTSLSAVLLCRRSPHDGQATSWCWLGCIALASHAQVDLLRRAELEAVEAYLAAQPGVAAVLPTSALTGLGVGAVRDWAVAQLPEGPTLYPKVRSHAAQPHAAPSQLCLLF